ncbi:MAG TPA: carboxypeptidase regulatory-like domain-containing protein [Granulicella sp.]|nr:carboxypeptidase regulatory-like domain-containing protein [Granulicella sp.]
MAQIDRTEIDGVVKDASGAVVSGSTVVVTQGDTGLRRQVTTNRDGIYTVPSLPPGTYTVTIDKDGFEETVVQSVLQTAGQTRTLNVTLTVGAQAQTVDVAASPALDETTATFGGSVQSVQVSEVPINGRNWSTLETLTPGAINLGTGGQGSIRFAGQGMDDANYRLDGNDMTGINNQAPKSALRLQVSTEAIQEFSVASAMYTAENGGSAGGQVNVVSKSGTNDLHGSVFEYLRNSAFDARQVLNRAPAAQAPFKLNQFGGTLGGPIRHDKTFFFASYEGFRQSLGSVQVGYVPTQAFKALVPSALQPFMAAYPTATSADPKSALVNGVPVDGIWTGSVSSPATEDAGFLRIDHRMNDNNTFYVRYNIDNGNSATPLGSLQYATVVQPRLQNGMGEYLHLFSSTLSNEVRFGFNRNLYVVAPTSPLSVSIIAPPFQEQYDNLSKKQASTSWDGRDDLTWSHQAHTVKAGVEIRRVGYNEQNTEDSTMTFTSYTNLLANTYSSYSYAAALPDKGLRKVDYYGYIQDEWKLRPNLTLNSGLRYNFFGPFYEVHNKSYPFDIASCTGLDAYGPNNPGLCKQGAQFTFPNYLDFDPRISLTWAPDVLQNHTVVRAGYGMFHGEDQLGDEDSPVVNDEPAISLNQNGSYPVNPALTPLTGLAATPRSQARNHPESYVQNFSLSVQQQLPEKFVGTVSYVGAKGTHLFRRSYTNLINPATGLRPLAPYYNTQIDTKFMEGGSIFHALQVNLTRNMDHGLFFAINYMWSHAINDGSVGAGEGDWPENVACYRCERSNSDDDVRQTASSSLVYQLPFGQGRRFLNNNGIVNQVLGGWEISNMLMARSGLPINITINRTAGEMPDGNNTYQRPDRVPGVSIYAKNRTPQNWLNYAAFAAPASGTWGNTPKNAALGPNEWQDDMALNKNFPLVEKLTLNLRAEAFNIFNRPQWGLPNSNFSSASSFGTITSVLNSGTTGTGTNRELQFAARINF